MWSYPVGFTIKFEVVDEAPRPLHDRRKPYPIGIEEFLDHPAAIDELVIEPIEK